MENQTVWKSKTELKLELKSHKIKMALDHNCEIFFRSTIIHLIILLSQFFQNNSMFFYNLIAECGMNILFIPHSAMRL